VRVSRLWVILCTMVQRLKRVWDYKSRSFIQELQKERTCYSHFLWTIFILSRTVTTVTTRGDKLSQYSK